MASRAFYLLMLAAWIVFVWLGLEWAGKPAPVPKAIPTTEVDWPTFFTANILPRLPVAEEFTTPLRPPNGEGVFVTLPFMEAGHLGEDWTTAKGDGGLGEPVYSLADGWVSVAQEFEGWGKVVFLCYRLPDGRYPPFVEVMLAQLQSIDVRSGQYVKRGQRIGTMGNVNGSYLAHLHWEVRQTVGLGIGPGFDTKRDGWLEPRDFLNAYRGSRAKEPLRIKVLDKAGRDGWGNDD